MNPKRLGPFALASLVAVPLASLASTHARAASLPDHDPISVLIVSDAVNPHGLPSDLLTEPGDLQEAIAGSNSGLRTSMVAEVSSSCIDEALELLHEDVVDVLIYFAHRSATACDGADRQGELTAATRGLLIDGGGVVVFHHGIYVDEGKDEILRLLGGKADQLAWAPEAGQMVIATAPDHFIASNHVFYEGEVELTALSMGVAPGRYPYFENVPDERYPGLEWIEKPGETRTLLFASDYDGPQILGYDLHRPDWSGHVVLYQPGEYKPNALDDVDGSNFQILANAIYYVATTRDEPMDEPAPVEPEGPDEHDTTQETGDDTGFETTDEAPVLDGEPSASCRITQGRVGWGAALLLAALFRRGRQRRSS